MAKRCAQLFFWTMMTLKPEEIFSNLVDNVMITGFKQSDDYFIIQREDEDPSNFHIELNNQRQGCYNGLREILVQDKKIVFRLNAVGQSNLNTDEIQIMDNIRSNSAYDNVV